MFINCIFVSTLVSLRQCILKYINIYELLKLTSLLALIVFFSLLVCDCFCFFLVSLEEVLFHFPDRYGSVQDFIFDFSLHLSISLLVAFVLEDWPPSQRHVSSRFHDPAICFTHEQNWFLELRPHVSNDAHSNRRLVFESVQHPNQSFTPNIFPEPLHIRSWQSFHRVEAQGSVLYQHWLVFHHLVCAQHFIPSYLRRCALDLWHYNKNREVRTVDVSAIK